MRVAVLGSGGREAALAWKLASHHGSDAVVVLPGNAGTPNRAPVDPTDPMALAEFCRQKKIDLVIPGGEAALVADVVGRMAAAGGPPVVGPDGRAARLEGSKAFAKEFMRRHQVATGSAQVVPGVVAARRFLERQGGGGLVVKYDGLAAGKGVWVCRSAAEAAAALDQAEARYGLDAVLVLEELLEGDELSLIGFTDGSSFRLLPAAQDHKQAFDGDRGPNTGGMGAFCPVPWCDAALLAAIETEIVRPTLRGLRADGLQYRGPLYFGLMVTAGGPRLLEYNVRFGDPETQVLVRALENDLLEVYQACLDGTLDRVRLRIRPEPVVGVVLAAEGYPAKGSQGLPLREPAPPADGIVTFHGGTERREGALVSDGGRLFTITATGPSLESARERAYEAIDRLAVPGTRCRRDIGRRPRVLQSPGVDPSPLGDGAGVGSDRPAQLGQPGPEGPAQPSPRVAVFVSGRGSNLQAIVQEWKSGILRERCRIVGVLSDNPEAGGLRIATAAGLPTMVRVPERGISREAYDRAVLADLAAWAPDFLVLAGFRRILSPVLVQAFPQRIVNIHPADPGRFRGLHAYRWAFSQKLPSTQVTVHLVDEGVDTGTVLGAATVDLGGADTLEEVEARGLRVEHELYPRILADLFARFTAGVGGR